MYMIVRSLAADSAGSLMRGGVERRNAGGKSSTLPEVSYIGGGLGTV